MLTHTPRFLALAALIPAAGLLTGCGAAAATYVHASDTTLGRVVVYRNGLAYFERTADVEGDHLTLKVPADKVDDFLKSLTVVDASTGRPAPISYPTKAPTSETGLLDMNIGITHAPGASHRLKLSYVTEAPSWKPSYRVVLGEGRKVKLEAWAIVGQHERGGLEEREARRRFELCPLLPVRPPVSADRRARNAPAARPLRARPAHGRGHVRK